MLIVQRLYIREFLKVLAVLSLGVGIAFSCLELIDKIDDFMPHSPPPLLLLEYVLLSLPKYVHYLLPMAVLLSSLFVFSQAIGRREIVAIKSAGGRMRSLLLPFVGLGLIITLLALAVSEVLVPPAAKKSRDLKQALTKKGRDVAFKEGTLYMRGKDGAVIRIGLYLPDQKLSREVTVYLFEASRLTGRIDAGTALWEGAIWKLRDVRIQNFASGVISTLPSMDYRGLESPKVFQDSLWKVEEATLGELVAYQRRLREAGFRNTKFTVDISSRLSYPLVNLFMLLLGISLSVGETLQRVPALRQRMEARTGGALVSAGMGLVISVLYWFSYSFVLTLGYTGTVDPFVAPWIVPAAFGAVTFNLYRRIPE